MKKSNGSDRNEPTRRGFLRTAGVAAVAVSAGGKAVAANDRLGVGVIGTGGRGGSHLHVLDWIKGHDKTIDIVAVNDVYRPRLNRAAENYGAKPYDDHRELLADPKVDVVTIATPDHHHGYQALDAVKAGKHVYCEKPVTHWRQFELTKQLADEVEKSGVAFQLGSQGMSDSAWHQMGQLVRDGLIGKPIYAQCGIFRVGDWGERGMGIDDPNAKPGPDLNWEAFLGDSPKCDFSVSRFFRWRMYEDYAGGPVTDLFPHSLTPVMSMLDVGMPERVVAAGGIFRYTLETEPDEPYKVERDVPDTFNMLVDYPEKMTLAVLGTQGNSYNMTGRRGSGHMVPVVSGWDGSITVEGHNIVFTPVDGSKAEKKEFKIEHGEDMAGYMQSFIECCRTGNPKTLSPMDLAFRVQTPLQMAALSLREGKVVRFDAEKREIVL